MSAIENSKQPKAGWPLRMLTDIGLVTGVEATRSFVGTEGYVPPERPGTPSADIYSLGKVLYEMSTGRDRQDYPELPGRLKNPTRNGSRRRS